MAYTTIDDPSAYFQTALYAGNNTTDHNITNDGNSDLQPDFVWIKQRNSDNPHVLHDTSRGFNGAGLGYNLQTNSTAIEGTNGAFESFNTDGFGVGGTNVASGAYNLSGSNYVAWQWKANGGTTASNTDGSITTTTQVNSDAGFSIVTWAGGGTGSLGHGLGVVPDMWIVKNRDYAVSWAVGFSDSSILGGTSNYLQLNTANATSTYNNIWGSSPANSSTITMAGDRSVNISGNDYVGYFFKAKQGYSKFGKYIGNGNANGPFVYTGFKPAFVMLKPAGIAEHWVIHDGTRDSFNKTYHYLFANEAEAEAAGGTHHIDLLSNGFKIRTSNNNWNTTNSSGVIYMAFAENPFTTSTGVPTTAR